MARPPHAAETFRACGVCLLHRRRPQACPHQLASGPEDVLCVAGHLACGRRAARIVQPSTRAGWGGPLAGHGLAAQARRGCASRPRLITECQASPLPGCSAIDSIVLPPVTANKEGLGSPRANISSARLCGLISSCHCSAVSCSFSAATGSGGGSDVYVPWEKGKVGVPPCCGGIHALVLGCAGPWPHPTAQALHTPGGPAPHPPPSHGISGVLCGNLSRRLTLGVLHRPLDLLLHLVHSIWRVGTERGHAVRRAGRQALAATSSSGCLACRVP